MPKHLFYACLIYIAARAGMIMLAPFYETGAARISSPILMLLFVAIPIFFMRRVAWAWKFMRWMAITEVAINALFFPKSKYFGGYTDLASVLVVVIIGACCVILWSLLRCPDTKVWFRGPDSFAVQQRD